LSGQTLDYTGIRVRHSSLGHAEGSVLYVSMTTIYRSGKYLSGTFTWVLNQDPQPACAS
jgi:hypothetical protein